MIDGAGLEGQEGCRPAIDHSREELLSVEQVGRWLGPGITPAVFRRRPVEPRPR